MFYKYFVGDTKGWVEVSLVEIERLNLSNLISSSSYIDDKYIYLDEDLDFSFFMCYLSDIPDFKKVYVNDTHFDKYKRYEGGLN